MPATPTLDIYDTILNRIGNMGQNIDPSEVLEAIADITANRAGDVRDAQRMALIRVVFDTYYGSD